MTIAWQQGLTYNVACALYIAIRRRDSYEREQNVTSYFNYFNVHARYLVIIYAILPK